jgi:hypothetical protein
VSGGWVTNAPLARYRRQLLRAAHERAVLQDLIDARDLAAEAGQNNDLGLLDGMIVLRQGVRTDRAAHGGHAVDRAIAELRSLIALGPIEFAHDVHTVVPREPAVAGPPPTTPPPEDALVETVASVLCDIGQGRTERLDELNDLALPHIVVGDHVGAPTARLARLLGVELARRFLFTNGPLLACSSILVDAAARLDRAGLGPWFINVRMLLRNVQDLFALAETAGAHRGQQEAWIVLLAAHLHRHETVTLIDELASRGMTSLLSAFLFRAAREGGAFPPAEIAEAVRDTAIDLDELDLAEQAQRLRVAWRPASSVERLHLAMIRSAASDFDGAVAAGRSAVGLDAGDLQAEQLLAALERGELTQLPHGFTSSPVRRNLRLAGQAAWRIARSVQPNA